VFVLALILVLVFFLRATGRRRSGTTQTDGAAKALEFDLGLAVAERVRRPSTAANLANRFGGQVALKVAVVGANRERRARVLRNDQRDVTVVSDEPILSAA
jgi:hypothetical protein